MKHYKEFIKRKVNILHLGILALIFGLALFGFWRFRGVELLQLYVVTASVLAYIFWGVIYHFYHEKLSWGLFLEYILIGALVVLLFFWMVFFA